MDCFGKQGAIDVIYVIGSSFYEEGHDEFAIFYYLILRSIAVNGRVEL
jgi:hypothetical protein